MQDEVKKALSVLRERGVRIPRAALHAAYQDAPPIKGSDIKVFKRWCEQAWQKKSRFIVGWGGVNKRTLTFHNPDGLERLQAHGKTIRAKVIANRDAAAAPTPARKKVGHPVSDVRQQTFA